jgi:DNA topoisomerase-1
MGKSLIIVESPAKIKTLKKFLGKDFAFASSVGHIRDLPAKGFGIDVEHDFEPQYETLPDKKEVIDNLKKEAKACDTVYLSPDPDREGEAIAWHIASILPRGTNIKRTTFNAITKESVLEALKNPREIDIALVNAQQARRLLDRIVGYKISPLLSRKLHQRSGVSAGRVQSVALKLVVDREREIENFKPVEYWNIAAHLKDGEPNRSFFAKVFSIDGKKWEKEPIEGKECYLIPNEEEAKKIVDRLNKARYTVTKVEKKEKKRNPEPPFITSTLQQEAARHFRYSSSKTMSIAQSLYEGVDLGSEGAEGLITYMRTDSVRIEPEAINEARSFIKKTFGPDYLPEQPKLYAAKKSAQDAHEAIRPTNLAHPPEKVKKHLNRDQLSLYTLIWNRFIASQMNPAIYDTVSADVSTNQDIVLRATGSILKFHGFLALYEEKVDDDVSDESRLLPPLEVGQHLNLIEVTSEQSFTKAPPRFTEASLVKELEKSGIGRPSTYATIMTKIQSRAYTVKENQRLKPTELGCVIAQFLEENFQKIMNIGFTAQMEDELELIAEDKKEWKSLIRDFWQDFIPTVDIAQKEAYVPKILTDLICPKCHEGKLQKIWSKSGYFHGCSRYPDCDYTMSTQEVDFNKDDFDPNFDWNQPCPICSGEMKVRHGRYGAFLGCLRYPDCKGIVAITKKGETPLPVSADAPHCPATGCDGRITARKSRFGKIFYSCTNFPNCDVIVNQLEDLETKYADHPKTAYKKSAKGASARGKLQPSKALAEIIGDEKITRGEAVKKLWDYIKQEQRQDPNDKRSIVPDEKLSKLFGSKEPISMFKIAGIIASNLGK